MPSVKEVEQELKSRWNVHVTGIEERAKLIRLGEPAECSASAVLLHTLYFAVCDYIAFLYNPLIVPEPKKKKKLHILCLMSLLL